VARSAKYEIGAGVDEVEGVGMWSRMQPRVPV
jgi:hypothetical protein